jgi:hypothetical protein
MLLLVDEVLACEKFAALEKRPQLHFIYYHNKIPLASILRYLSSAFEETKAKQIQFLKTLPVRFTEPIISYAEFAERIGVSAEAVQEVLTVNSPSGYVSLTNSLVSAAKLEQLNCTIEVHLKKSEKLTLNDATRIIEAEGISDVSRALNHLGYKIKWLGINTEKAEVYKPKNTE